MALLYRSSLTCPLLNNSYRKFSTNISKFKSQRRHTTNNHRPEDGDEQFRKEDNNVFFEKMLNFRRLQAHNSIVVQVHSANSQDDLQSYCMQFGNILSMHHYKINQNEHFILMELKSPEVVKRIMSSAAFLENDPVAPMKTSTLWFRNMKTQPKLSKRKQLTLTSIDGCNIPTSEAIVQILQEAQSVTEQMKSLHNSLKLTDLEIRLRFYTAYQIEQCFSGIFPGTLVRPFGSSVNGFGKRGCDLDLVFSLQSEKTNPLSRLIFHAKRIDLNDKAKRREFMSTISKNMEYFVPGVHKVQRILEARVPIIKFSHWYTGVDCDLSMTNLTAIYMSELLCTYGEIDWRVRPLVFTIRIWAQVHKLTNPHPGRWITNFSLSLLVIFYLQNKKVVPSLNTLRSYATHEDIRSTEAAVDCTFLRDIRKLPLIYRNSKNEESLESLLYGFFHYYANFNFDINAISIREGSTVRKRDNSPLYISNPLETSLNVSKNVSAPELQRIIVNLRDALFITDTMKTANSWGLLPLFGIKGSTVPRNGNNTINISKLFVEDNEIGVERNFKENAKSDISECASNEFLTSDSAVVDNQSTKNNVKQH